MFCSDYNSCSTRSEQDFFYLLKRPQHLGLFSLDYSSSSKAFCFLSFLHFIVSSLFFEVFEILWQIQRLSSYIEFCRQNSNFYISQSVLSVISIKFLIRSKWIELNLFTPQDLYYISTKFATKQISIPKFVNFIYSEKATKFCEISTVDLSYVVPVKSSVEISQNFVAFSEYMNFSTNSSPSWI